MSRLFGTDRRVLVLAVARMADAIGNSFLIVVLPAFIASGQVELTGLTGIEVLGIELTEELLIGIVLSLFGFLNSFLQPFTGRLSDRTGRRRPFILAGLGLLGLASAGYVVASDYHVVLVLRALQGVGAALTIPATVALVNELATAGDRGGNFGVFNTFRLIGFGFGPFVAGAVSQHLGFGAAFAVAVVGAGVSFLLVTLLVEDPPTTGASAGDDLTVAVRGRNHLLDPVFTLGVATVCMGVGIALFATLRDPINARLVQGDTWFGAQFGAAVLGNVALQVPVGRASDRYGRKPFIVGGFALLVPAMLAQGVVTTPVGMLLARTVQGVAVALVFAPSLAVAGDLAGEGRSGSTLAVLTMGFGLGTAIGPLVSGYLVRYGFAVPFVLGAGLGALGLVLVATQVDETVSADDESPA
ncbi:MAG: MFS transporter [Halobacteriaceae archaeon]